MIKNNYQIDTGMKTLKITIIIFLFTGTLLQAQKVNIKSGKNKIGEENYHGFVSKINGGEDEIEGMWYKSLRTLGRLREEGNYLTVKEAQLQDFGDVPINIFSKITASDSLSEVWIGANLNEISEDSAKLIGEKLETFLYNFTLTYYKEEAQKKVDEAERAVAFTNKKHEKLKAEGIELTKDLENNKAELARLKALLEKNELEDKVINQKIIDNKALQDSTLVDVERLKGVAEKKRKIKSAIE